MMKLFIDISESVDYFYEANGDKKDLFIAGRYITGDVKNKNGRMYPMDILEPEIDRYVTEMVRSGRALGECTHSCGPSVNLKEVSHRVIDLHRNGSGYDGKAIVLNTPQGSVIRGILEGGGKIGVSTRGMGSLKENNGAMEVQKDFRLAAIDCVADPSGPGCFVNGIMEGVEYFFDPVRNTWKEEKVIEIQEHAKHLSKAQREEQALKLFEEYMSVILLNEVDFKNATTSTTGAPQPTNQYGSGSKSILQPKPDSNLLQSPVLNPNKDLTSPGTIQRSNQNPERINMEGGRKNKTTRA
jgi:hypothetical protein